MSTSQVIILANGEALDGPMVRRALDATNRAYVIAADGGARLAPLFNLPIHTLIGDMDSLSPSEVDAIAAAGADVLRFPAEKAETDLELALYHAVEHGAKWIRVIGATGGRIDQTLANMYLLALPHLEGVDVRFVAGKQDIRLLRSGEYEFVGAKGDTLSLLPLTPSVDNIFTENLYYPLHGESLVLG
ncbi:MAG: thiamine diphosphokinase, partial [Chloroflexi bacterium]